MRENGVRLTLLQRLSAAARVLLRPDAHELADAVVPQPDNDALSSEGVLAGKTVLVVGLRSPLGPSLVHEIAGAGARVCFCDARREVVDSFRVESHPAGGGMMGLVADIRNRDDNDTICSAVEAELGRVDVVVINMAAKNDHGIKEAFETNLFGPVDLAHRVCSRMREQKTQGSVIFISSIHESVVSGDIGYSASMAALRMVIKEMAMQHAEHGIRVNGIAPGIIDMEPETASHPPMFISLRGTSVPACYVARAAVYLASDYYSWHTTGAILTIDAGLSLHSYMTLHSLAP